MAFSGHGSHSRIGTTKQGNTLTIENFKKHGIANAVIFADSCNTGLGFPEVALPMKAVCWIGSPAPASSFIAHTKLNGMWMILSARNYFIRKETLGEAFALGGRYEFSRMGDEEAIYSPIKYPYGGTLKNTLTFNLYGDPTISFSDSIIKIYPRRIKIRQKEEGRIRVKFIRGEGGEIDVFPSPSIPLIRVEGNDIVITPGILTSPSPHLLKVKIGDYETYILVEVEKNENPYDLNKDGEVNRKDFEIFMKHYNTNWYNGDKNYSFSCDFDEDMDVDLGDLILLSRKMNHH